MIRIGLMAKRNFLTSRRRFLGGLGATAAGLWTPHVAAGETLPLAARAGTIALRPGQPDTPVSALAGPAPNLRFRRGIDLDIVFQNALQAPAVINWHGLDGVPSAEPLTAQRALATGARASLTLPLRHAGTHLGDIRLLGDAMPSRALPLIVEETDPQAVDRDQVLLVEDFLLRPDGTAIAPGSDPKDATAVYTVNGLISPGIAANSNERLRLRLINGCQRHVIALKIEGIEVRVMALDGQPAEPFSARNGAVVLAPGARADVYLDLHLRPGSTQQILLHDGKDARAVARLTVRDEVSRQTLLQPAPPLPSNGLPAQLELRGAQRFDVLLAGSEWVVPAKFTTSAPPAFRVKPGRIAVLALNNRSPLATVFHLHGHHFRLLDRLDDGWKPYWLDTLAIEPGQTQRIAFAAETAGHWLIESAATDWAAPKLVRWYSVE